MIKKKKIKNKKKVKYYVHPIDRLDPALSRNYQAEKKTDNFIWGIWAIFIITVCILIPGLEVLSDFFNYGLLKD